MQNQGMFDLFESLKKAYNENDKAIREAEKKKINESLGSPECPKCHKAQLEKEYIEGGDKSDDYYYECPECGEAFDREEIDILKKSKVEEGVVATDGSKAKSTPTASVSKKTKTKEKTKPNVPQTQKPGESKGLKAEDVGMIENPGSEEKKDKNETGTSGMQKVSESKVNEEGETAGKTVSDYEIKPRADLRYADLQNADLQGDDLQGANLTGAKMHGADMHGANLTGA